MMVLATMKVLEFRGNCIAFENQDLQAVFAAGLWPFFLLRCYHSAAIHALEISPDASRVRKLMR